MLLPTSGAAPVAQVFAFGCMLEQRDKGNRQDRSFATICPSPGCTLQFSLLFSSSLLILSLTLFLASSGVQALARF